MDDFKWKNIENEEFEFWEYITEETFKTYDYLKELGFEDREEQQNMSLDIIQSIQENKNIVVEAGVGIGKSYAYLIPLMLYHKKTNQPFIVSTSTIALQEQLQKDISSLNSILHLNIPSIIAKGKTHYLCKKKITDVELLRKLKQQPSKIDRIYYDTFSDTEWSKINVNKCLFKKCTSYKFCYFPKLRDEIQNFNGAIICNHDLLFENQKRKAEQKKLILPDTEFIIIDEAHNLEEKGRNSFKQETSLDECLNIIKKSNTFLRKNSSDFNYKNITTAEREIKSIFKILNSQVDMQTERAIKEHKIIIKSDLEICNVNSTSELRQHSARLYRTLEDINIDVQLSDNSYSDDDNLISDLENLEYIFENLKDSNSNNIFWIENKRKIILNTCSKDVDKEIKKILFDDNDTIKVLTSATLNTSDNADEPYSYYMKNIGLTDNTQTILSEPKKSPFDYENHMLCYYSHNITPPSGNHENYIKDITNKIIELLNITNGKTLILFTSKSDMKLVYEKLKKLPFDILIQKDGSSQNSTKEEFKSNINSVLLSTGAFWEGIDIKGKSLSNVIIVRLPFPLPTPIINHKCSLVTNRMQVLVPEMKIKLKQGIGRLIRGKEDTGIISILDSRVNTYLNKITNCIPTSNITKNIEDVKQFVIENKINE